MKNVFYLFVLCMQIKIRNWLWKSFELVKKYESAFRDDEYITHEFYIPLGIITFKGQGIKASKEKALDIFLQSAQIIMTHLVWTVLVMHFSGEGVPVDLQKSYEWINKAVENNLQRFCSGWIVKVFSEGIVVKSIQKGIQLLDNASLAGNHEASKQQQIFRKGFIVERNLQKAQEYLERITLSGEAFQQRHRL